VVVLTIAVLIDDGFHVPTIPLVEVVSKAGATVFWQSDPIGLKVGATVALTVISIVVEAVAH
jgi:hypothetical protein